ncbi:MAG: flippase activity-associated protein Agl23 [Halobacteriales archaeon]
MSDPNSTEPTDDSTHDGAAGEPDDGAAGEPDNGTRPARSAARETGGAPEATGVLGRVRDAAAGADRATRAVVAVTAVALLARLVGLGYRVMHFDEARVAFWAMEWSRTGTWHYRYIIHGPFIQHVDRWLYTVLPPVDFVTRLPVALVGGLLPLSVLLYRRHFRDGELVALSGILAASPLLLYYSRFMRSDVLVAAFMFVGLGFLVRLYDERRPRYLYLATAFLALGFASKENAVIYPVTWVGMLAAVGGMELLYPRRFESRAAFVSATRRRAGAWVDWALSGASRRWVGHLVGAVALFGLLTLYFYAPRGMTHTGATWVERAGTGLWADPLRAAGDAVTGIQEGFDHWGSSGEPSQFCSGFEPTGDDGGIQVLGLQTGYEPSPYVYQYLCHFGRELVIIRKVAMSVAVLSVVGFLAEWVSDRPRLLVTGAFAWGVASVVGYAAGTDIFFPSWIAVHVVVALAIPAAVGLALLVRWAREALADEDLVGTVLAGGVALLLVTSMVGVGVHHAYLAPQSGEPGEVNVVQYAQPEGHMQEQLRTVRQVSHANDGLDVVVYGSDFINEANDRFEPACLKWLVPWAGVSWTLYSADADVRCVDDPNELADVVEQSDAPIVIASRAQADGPRRQLGDDFVQTPGYQVYLSEAADRKVVFFFDGSQVDYDGPTVDGNRTGVATA